jgi:hypothetical protein
MPRWILILMGVMALAGCSGMKIEDYAGKTPEFRPEEYFLGQTRAWGFFQDRFGNIRRQFVVDITGSMEGEVLVLDESFVYADGERAKRVWRIRPLGDGRYEGTAGDVIGVAQGRAVGNAMRWVYDFDLPVGENVWRVRFDDWMLQQDGEVMLNKSTVTKFGLELGEVFIFFRRLTPAGAAAGGGTSYPVLAQQAAE